MSEDASLGFTTRSQLMVDGIISSLITVLRCENPSNHACIYLYMMLKMMKLLS